jgi:hypothetical protein
VRDKISSFLEKKASEIRKLGEFYPEKKSFVIDFIEIEQFDT